MWDPVTTVWRVIGLRMQEMASMRVYPKVFGLSRKRNKQQQQTFVEKQHKGLWRQNSLN
jgi:hypothetical protein